MLMTTQFSEPVLAWLNSLPPEAIKAATIIPSQHGDRDCGLALSFENVDFECSLLLRLVSEKVPHPVAHGETCIVEGRRAFTAVRYVHATKAKAVISNGPHPETEVQFDPYQDPANWARWDEVLLGIVTDHESLILDHYNCRENN